MTAIKAFNRALNKHFLLVTVVLLVGISLPLLRNQLTQTQTIRSKAQPSLAIIEAEARCERGYPENFLSWQKEPLAAVYKIDRSDSAFFYSTLSSYPDRRVNSTVTYTYTVTGLDSNYQPVTGSSKSVTLITKNCVTSQPVTPATTKKTSPTPTPTIQAGGSTDPVATPTPDTYVPPQQVSIINNDDAPKPGFLEMLASEDNLPVLVTIIVIILTALGIGFKFMTRKKYNNVDWDWVKPSQPT